MMSIQQIHRWIERLRAETVDLADLKAFEKLSIEDVARELDSVYPIRFLDRWQRTKREIGFAQSQSRSNRWDSRLLHECLHLTSESGLMTAMAIMISLRFRRVRDRGGVFQLTSGAGFNLYRDPDGWRIKLLHERTVSLTKESLKNRGWLLNGQTQVSARHDGQERIS